ncbi:MAG TPA: phosphate/phosphite/phosphonate ABC transporter substrate-binding protein [Candidatus Cloacimonadota bacterium]|nr:phosphate/phosphite/phosphonate ABC transporter substrate-binding protein [Candidatus Cloacimonadota bacterium]HQB40409.1 phosphate/phosphite/phosphonate ABC transporter substrate-binding protein [Candidatus Cloacimonadota bacterium]
MTRRFFLLLVSLFLLLTSCSEQPLGSKRNPIKLYFVPSMEANKIITSAEAIKTYLQKETGLYFSVAVPTSYAAVIEAMGTDEADIAFLATFAYVLAHEKYNAEVALTTIRNDLSSYRGQFVANVNSGISEIKDIEGKVIAYTDAASTSGYLYPSAILKQNNITPKGEIMAGGHPQVILAVYEGTADVGCTFWSEEHEGKPKDARNSVEETYPDVYDKVKIVGFTDWIPNDTVTFRDKFPKEIKEKVVDALLKYAQDPEGKKELQALYNVDGFIKSTDSDYDIVRSTLETLGMDANELFK